MIIIQLIIVLVAIAGILFLRQKQILDDGRRLRAEAELVVARQRLADASADLSHIETELFPIIDAQLDRPYSDDIRKGVVTIGMPAGFLSMAWGHPQRIERSDDQREMEYWLYEGQGQQDRLPTQVTVQHQRVIKLKDF